VTWREEALRIRVRFDANKHVQDRRLAVALVQQGEEELQNKKHPDPYLDPKAPDGTLWERNPPLPKEILQMTPDEQEWYKEYVKYHNSPTATVPAWDDPAVSPYPKFVWTPTGGWYCNPPNWRKNTGLAMFFVLVSSGVVWYISAQLERRPVPPYRFIPSQLWCKYAAVDDPRLRSSHEPEMVTHNPSPYISVPNKWPREYERVPELEEVDRNDFVAYTKAKHQRVRDRAVHREELKILQERLSDCVKREEVNHQQRCRSQSKAYWNSFRKYRSQGWLASH
jgi:NADH dehydrogenase (ubiquinone) 1 beta subcomplex subunit 10